MRCGGSASPSARKQARTRSRLSPTALSASPTTAKAMLPGATSTCTSTGQDIDALERHRPNRRLHVLLPSCAGNN